MKPPTPKSERDELLKEFFDTSGYGEFKKRLIEYLVTKRRGILSDSAEPEDMLRRIREMRGVYQAMMSIYLAVGATMPDDLRKAFE